AIFRAFSLAPSEALAERLLRLADATDSEWGTAPEAARWERIASALAAGLADRADVPPAAKGRLLHRVALWHQARGDVAAAEAALVPALAIEPTSEPLLFALADVQRRAPGRPLVETLRRLADASAPARAFGHRREAVEVAEGPA